jgi:hypothetical protein
MTRCFRVVDLRVSIFIFLLFFFFHYLSCVQNQLVFKLQAPNNRTRLALMNFPRILCYHSLVHKERTRFYSTPDTLKCTRKDTEYFPKPDIRLLCLRPQYDAISSPMRRGRYTHDNINGTNITLKLRFNPLRSIQYLCIRYLR